MSSEFSPFLLFSTFVILVAGGIIIVIAGMRNRARELEMVHRERLAMIERGLPPPGDLLRSGERTNGRSISRRGLSIGIAIMGVGLALATLISFAGGASGPGVGVGGAIAIVGLAFVVIALVSRPASPGGAGLPAEPPSSGPADSAPPPPPSAV